MLAYTTGYVAPLLLAATFAVSSTALSRAAEVPCMLASSWHSFCGSIEVQQHTLLATCGHINACWLLDPPCRIAAGNIMLFKSACCVRNRSKTTKSPPCRWLRCSPCCTVLPAGRAAAAAGHAQVLRVGDISQRHPAGGRRHVHAAVKAAASVVVVHGLVIGRALAVSLA